MIYEINKSTELYHWGFKKGEKRPGSKYIARVGTFPKYRYFYTQSEYNAYLTNGDKNQNKSTSNQNSLLGKKLSSIFTISKKEDKKVENVNSNKTIPHSRPVNIGEGKVKAEKGEKIENGNSKKTDRPHSRPVTIGEGKVEVKINKKKGMFITHSLIPQIVSSVGELIANQVNNTSNSDNSDNNPNYSIIYDSHSKPDPDLIPFPGANVDYNNSKIDWEYIYDNTAYPNGVNAEPIGFSTSPYDMLTTIVGDDSAVVVIPPQEETPGNNLKKQRQRKQVADAYQEIEDAMTKLETRTIPSLRTQFESTGKIEAYDALVKCENDYIQLQFAQETIAAARMLFTMSYGYDPILRDGQESYHKIDTTAPYITYRNLEYDEFKDAIWEEGKRYNVIRENGHIVTYVCATWGSYRVFDRVTDLN